MTTVAGLLLAQANVARLRHPWDDPRMAEFVAAFDAVNALAERSPGFVWRHRAAGGHATVDDDPLLLINLSVWRTYQSLHDFTYRTRHGHFTRRRREWFDPVAQPNTVLWWIPPGPFPTPADALNRLRLLRRYGPQPQAFGLRSRFGPDGRPEPVRRGPRR